MAPKCRGWIWEEWQLTECPGKLPYVCFYYDLYNLVVLLQKTNSYISDSSMYLSVINFLEFRIRPPTVAAPPVLWSTWRREQGKRQLLTAREAIVTNTNQFKLCDSWKNFWSVNINWFLPNVQMRVKEVSYVSCIFLSTNIHEYNMQAAIITVLDF